MLEREDVQALVRELASTNVLSVYMETKVTDPAMRDAWRPALSTALRDVGARLPEADRPEFERARAVLEGVIPSQNRIRGAEGWMAFVTAEGSRYVSELPTTVHTVVVWRKGPVVAPYMRVLKEHRVVIVALVDSRSARIYQYSWGKLAELPERALSVDEHPAAGDVPDADRRGQAVMSPRSVTGTERADRRQAAAFESMATELASRLPELAGDEGWIVIGGTREWARAAADALPAHLADRVLVSAALDHDATSAEIADAARDGATTLRAAHGNGLLEPLFENAGAKGRSASGISATQRALRAHAVDLLLLSPEFLRGQTGEAEDEVRAALLQGAEVEVLSSSAAERLDRDGGGIAARLRFTPGAV